MSAGSYVRSFIGRREKMYGVAIRSEPFRMKRAFVILAEHAPKRRKRCSVGPAGNVPFPWMPARFKQWAVRWTNDVGAGSTYCVSRKAAQEEMARYLRQPLVKQDETATVYVERF